MAQTVFSSNEQLNFASHTNLDDSSLSSDAGDILIRSTRIIFPERTNVRDLGSTSTSYNKPDNVQITANKLRSTTQHVTDEVQKSRRSKKQEYVHVPPALRANLQSCSPSAPVSLSDGCKVPKGHAVIKTSTETRKNKQPHKDGKGTHQSSVQIKPSGDEGHEVVISRYAAGGKGAIMAALKQRSQSAPLRREVKVQLLGQRSAVQSPEFQTVTPIFGNQGPGLMLDIQPGTLPYGDQGCQSSQPQRGSLLLGDQGSSAACTAAVVTAATIAATAPLLKAQSEMELRVSQMSEGLRTLLEADRLPGQSLERRAGRDASGSREGSQTQDRVAQLEQQLSSLTQQRLQHLELIQNQQMGLQSRLLESALSVVTGHASVPAAPPLRPDSSSVLAAGLPPGLSGSQPVGHSQTHLTVVDLSTDIAQPSQRTGAGGGPSTPETPAPRRVIPKPTHWSSSTLDTHNPQSSTRNAQKLPTRTQKSTHPSSKTHGGSGTIQNTTRPGPAKHNPRSGSKPQRTPSTTPGSGRLPEAIHDDRRSGSCTARTGAMSAAVAVATPQDGDGPPEQFRDAHQQQETFRVSTATPGQPSSSAPANQGDSSAVERANRMLKDLGRLKAEMHTLLTTGDAFPGQISRDTAQPSSGSPSSTSRPPAPHIPAAPAAATLPPPAVSVPSQNAAVEVISPSVFPLPRPGLPLLQRNPPVPSMFEDAEKVLRQVQRNKKVLEENLQAMLRAKEGEVLHCQLEALANNRDTTEEVRIKKTVDAWIKALSKDVQTEAAGQDLVAQCRPRERDAAAPTAAQKKTTGTRDERGKDMLRTAGTKSSGRVARGQSGKTEVKTKRTHPSAKLRPAQHMQPQARVEVEEERPGDEGDDGAGEDYLVKLYGKALYEGHRRTLKKGPYLRFSSPSPRSRGPRPRVVESVRGVKMKSSKTQTNLAPDRTVSFPLPPSTNQPQYIFSPTRGGLNDPMEGYLLPIAIPLGRRRVDGMAPQPSRVFISDRPIVVTTSLPPSPPRPAPAPRKPTVTLLEVKSERRRPPKLTVQVQPSVNIQPPASTLVGPPPPGPPPPPPQVQTVEETLERRKRKEEEEEEKEENVFPGTNFLAVVDISQETEEDSEVLDGENRTVQSEERSDASVEEDTNAPVGSEMIRQYINEALTEIVAQMLDQRDGQTQERSAPPTPTQEPPPPPQEDLVPTPMPTPEASISPIVASPGRSPLGTPEPSDQGSPELTPRDVQPAQPQQSTPTEPEPVVTPASTPTPTPPTLSPQPSLEPPSMRNHPWGDAELPLAEEQPHNSLEMNPQPSKPLVMSVAVEEPLLVSPPISVPSIPPPQPPRSPTPPPAPLPGPATPSSAPSSSTEDSSSSSSSTVSRTDTAVKHISEGELLLSYNKLLAAQAYEEGLCLPCDIPSFSSSLHEVQDMDYDPPSEGQVTRPQVPPHHDPLLSLLAKMDQGVVSTHAGAMTRPGGSWGLEAEAEEEGSVGEVSEGQRPRLTLAGERVMTGHSLLGSRTRTTGSRIHHPLRTTDPSSGAGARTTGSPEIRQRRGSSPGQLSQSADLTELSLGDTHQGPVTIADLGVEPVMSTRTSNFHTGSSPSPAPQIQDTAPLGAQAVDWLSVSTDRPAPILVRTQETHSGAEAQGGSRVMAVHLPSAGPEEQQEEEASISLGAPGGADSNSSGNDVF